MKLGERIKSEIVRQGLSAYRVSQMAGLTPSVMTRFMNQDRGMQLETAEKIAEALGLELAHRDLVVHDRREVDLKKLTLTFQDSIAKLHERLCYARCSPEMEDRIQEQIDAEMKNLELAERLLIDVIAKRLEKI